MQDPHATVKADCLKSHPQTDYLGSHRDGSGSLEQDGLLCIVAMEKEKQTGLVHDMACPN
jgi:hypothetical protein